MRIAVILGNRMNDDGSLSDKGYMRAQLALNVYRTYNIKLILSGGLANKKAGITEAAAMRDYLVNEGVAPSDIVLEQNSLTTKQNALYSVPIAQSMGARELWVCTTSEHANRRWLNPTVLFRRIAKKYRIEHIVTLTEKDF